MQALHGIAPIKTSFTPRDCIQRKTIFDRDTLQCVPWLSLPACPAPLVRVHQPPGKVPAAEQLVLQAIFTEDTGISH